MTGAKNQPLSTEETESRNQTAANAERLADFVMFAQRSALLDLSKELNSANVAYAQFFLLGYLANEDYLTLSEISNKMGHSTAAATGMVDRLEKLGYVQRFHPAEDRRKVMVQITRKGIELVGRLRNDIAKNIETLAISAPTSAYSQTLKSHSELSESKRFVCDDSDLIESINRGLPGNFWGKFQQLKKKGEDSELDEEEAEELTRMADRIEEADAERLEAAVELARLRGVPFEQVLAEFEIETAVP